MIHRVLESWDERRVPMLRQAGCPAEYTPQSAEPFPGVALDQWSLLTLTFYWKRCIVT
jgi:hypothetical protein